MSSAKDFKLKISGNESVEAVGTFNGEGVYKVRKGGGAGGKAQPTYKYITIDNKPVDGRKVKRFSNKSKPVAKKNVIIKKEEPKKTTPKPVAKKNELSEKHLNWLAIEKRKQVLREEDLKKYLNSDKLLIPFSKKGTYEEEAKKLKTKAFINNEKAKEIIKFFETRERNNATYDDFKKNVWSKKLKELNKEFAPKKSTPKPVIKENVIIKETPKPVIEIADKEKARLKKLEPKKQTADQLEKRRIKYQENREKELARKRAYREANKQELNAKQDAYRETGKSKAYQKAYREKNAKIYEPRRTKEEVEAGVKAYGLGKGALRYKKDIDELKKKDDTTPRKVRTDAGNKRGEYKKKEKKQLVKYPKPSKKSGENDEVFQTRLGLWDLVRQGKLPPSNLTMRKAILITYGDGIRSGGKDITTGEWIKSKEKAGRNIERDGLGVGNLQTAENDPDEVF